MRRNPASYMSKTYDLKMAQLENIQTEYFLAENAGEMGHGYISCKMSS